MGTCPFCTQSALHPSPVDSDWSEEDWDANIEREKRKEKQRREEEVKKREKIEEQEKISNYYPLSPICDPHHEEETLPHLTSEQKIKLDPNYYPPNYIPELGDALTLVNNLIPDPILEGSRKHNTEFERGQDNRKQKGSSGSYR